MKVIRPLLILMLATASLTGCATAVASSGDPNPSSRARLTRSALEGTNTDNLYEAIGKLRPEWLSSRGPTSVTDATPTAVSVYMGASMLGKADALKEISVSDVAEVRYWDAASASARFGMGNPRGVIEVIHK